MSAFGGSRPVAALAAKLVTKELSGARYDATRRRPLQQFPHDETSKLAGRPVTNIQGCWSCISVDASSEEQLNGAAPGGAQLRAVWKVMA
jgi:hypothetical protein